MPPLHHDNTHNPTLHRIKHKHLPDTTMEGNNRAQRGFPKTQKQWTSLGLQTPQTVNAMLTSDQPQQLCLWQGLRGRRDKVGVTREP